MENLHTPGPWHISWNTFAKGAAHGIYAAGEMDLKGLQIATVTEQPTMSNKADEKTGKANAMLIAAAPAMFEALVKVKRHLESIGMTDAGEPLKTIATAIDNALNYQRI